MTDIDDFLSAEKPKVERDRWGRYLLPEPGETRNQSWQRATTFAKMITDSFGLQQWMQRMVAKGLALRPDLVDLASTMDVERNKDDLNSLVEQAKDAAGQKSAANRGTTLHKFSEIVDEGGSILDIPEKHRPDIQAYLDALSRDGITVIPNMVERITLVPEFAVAGTLDRGLALPGALGNVIGDVKTGKKLTYNKLEHAVQLALYAHGVNTVGVWDPVTRTWDTTIKVREDVAIIMHIPAGTGQCTLHEVDIAEGWEAVQVCATVRGMRKKADNWSRPLDLSLLAPQSASSFTELLSAELGDVGTVRDIPSVQSYIDWSNGVANPVDPSPWDVWFNAFSSVKTREEASKLYREAKQDPSLTQEQLAKLVREGKAALGMS